MSETSHRSESGISYERAQPVSTRSPTGAQTGSGARPARTTAPTRAGKTVRMRVIPNQPRQSGDEARTD